MDSGMSDRTRRKILTGEELGVLPHLVVTLQAQRGVVDGDFDAINQIIRGDIGFWQEGQGGIVTGCRKLAHYGLHGLWKAWHMHLWFGKIEFHRGLRSSWSLCRGQFGRESGAWWETPGPLREEIGRNWAIGSRLLPSAQFEWILFTDNEQLTCG